MSFKVYFVNSIIRGGAKVLRGGAQNSRRGAQNSRRGAKSSQGRCAPPHTSPQNPALLYVALVKCKMSDGDA